MNPQMAQDHQTAQTVADQMNRGFPQPGDARGEPACVFVHAVRHGAVVHRIDRIAAARKPEAQALHCPASHPQSVHEDQRFAHWLLRTQHQPMPRGETPNATAAAGAITAGAIIAININACAAGVIASGRTMPFMRRQASPESR